MRTILLLSVVGMGMLPSLARADSTPEQIAKSIDNLKSKRPLAREQAMKLLEYAGEPALGALRKAAQSDDIDLSKRAAAILARIEKEIENRKYVEVPRYSFKFNDDMLKTVVYEFKKNFKTEIVLDEKRVANPKRTVTFEVNNVTAFEAITKFMEVAELKESDQSNPNPNSAESRRIIRGGVQIWDGRYNPQALDLNRLVLVDGKSDLPSVNSGPLRIRVLSQGKDHAVRTNGSNEIGIKLDVRPISPPNWRGNLGIDIRKAIDEHGQNLTQSYLREPSETNPFFGNETIFFNGGGFAIQGQVFLNDFDGAAPSEGGYNPRQLPVTLIAGKKTSRVLKEMEGVIHGRMLTPPTALLTIDDLSKLTQKDTIKAANFSIQVLEVQLQTNNGQYPFIRYRMTTNLNPFQNNFAQGLGGMMIMDEFGVPGANQPQVTIRDAANGEIRTSPQILSSNNDGLTMSVEMQLQLRSISAAKPPFKLVVMGQKEVEISVPFSLKNIQLP